MQSALNIIIKSITVLVVFLAVTISSFGQYHTNLTQYVTPPSVALDPASGNPQTGDFGSIGAYNGRLNYVIPLLKTGGRGEADYTISLDLNKLWTFDYYYDEYEEDGNSIYNQYTLANSQQWWGNSLRYMPGMLLMRTNYGSQPYCVATNQQYYFEGSISFVSQDGSEITLFSETNPGGVWIQCTSYSPYGGTYNPVSLGTVFKSVDGSGVKFVSDQALGMGAPGGLLPGYLYFPNGTRYRIDGNFVSWIEDKNGNRTSFAYQGTGTNKKVTQIVDSNGRTVNISQGLQDGQYGLHDDIAYSGLNGATQTIRVTYAQLGSALRSGETLKNQTQLFGYLQCPTGSSNCPSPDLINPTVVTSVIFPGNRTFQYKYNSYGELARVDAPQGAAFEYDWGGSLEGGSANGVINSGNPYNYDFPDLFRQVLEKRSYSNGGSGSTYDFKTIINKSSPFTGYPNTYPDMVSIRTITFYGKNNTLVGSEKRTFFGHPLEPAPKPNEGQVPQPIMYPAWWRGRDKETKYYGSDGVTLIRRDLKKWTAETETGLIANARVAKQITISPEGSNAAITLQEIEYDGTGSSDYFVNLNPKRTKSYGYKFLSTSSAVTSDFQTIFQMFEANDLVAISENDYNYDQSYRNRNILGLVAEQRVLNPQNTTQVVAKSQVLYDESAYPIISAGTSSGWVNPNTNYRGNPTTARAWDSNTNGWIETHAQFDNFGNARKAWDARGNVTEVEFSSTYQYAFPTKTISAVPDPSGQRGSSVSLETTITYDFYTGLPLTTTDSNGQTTAMQYNDPLLRPTAVIPPSGGAVTETIYNDTPGNIWVKTRTQIDGTNWAESTVFADGLGRAFKNQKKDNQGDVFSETVYDSMGRPYLISNPYRIGETKLWTTTNYDVAGRPYQVVTPDNAVVQTNYDLSVSGLLGTVTLVTDQAGKQRRSISNALGQLMRVDEPDDSGNLGTVSSPTQPTYYTYDTLSNLVQVNQGVQQRNFIYNSLSRLLSATNPESGTIGYVYDNNGNLTQKTDARGVVTNYVYDNLNRVVSRTYNDGTPNVTYTYDNLTYGKGKLIQVTSSISTTNYTQFDNLGRILTSQQLTDGQTYNFGYSYNLSGALVSETYPSGRVVTNQFETDGDLAQVNGTFSGQNKTYVGSFTYTSAGAVGSMQLGNGKWENTVFNSRLQPTQIGLGNSATTQDLWKVNYQYGATASQNNGNVTQQTITVPSQFTAVQNYTYDSLNRLKSAQETIGGSQTWKQTFTFDRYGNRNFDAAQTTTLGSCPTNICNPSINPANNRVTTHTFDNAGNTTIDAEGRQFFYDAENKQKEVRDAQNNIIGQYLYDGDGKRVKKLSANDTTIFVYDAGGKLASEYLITTSNSQAPTTSYLTNDTLGSPRVTTDSSGNVVSRRDFRPYGEEIYRPNQGTDKIRQKFTSYERDNETNLDYAKARMFGSSLGRFTSPDSIFIKKGRLFDPQQLNLYIYVRNNPFQYVDVTGEDLIPANAKSASQLQTDLAKLLTQAELANLQIVAGKNIVIVNSQFQSGSTAYQQVVAAINSSNQTTYLSVPQGSSFTIPSGPNKGMVITWDDLKGGATIPIDTNDLRTATQIYVIVPETGGNSRVNGQQIGSFVPFPREFMSIHEVGHSNCGPGQCAVDIENKIRSEQTPPLLPRSGTDHESIPTDKVQTSSTALPGVDIKTKLNEPRLIPQPAQVQPIVEYRKPLPLPTPPNIRP